MKRITLLPFLVFCTNLLFAQTPEFETYTNGLIYSEETMVQLAKIVDSLNLKYKTCELNKTFLSKAQAKGHYIELSKGNLEQARKDLENNISFEAFLDKYPKSEVKKNILIVRFEYENYKDEKIIEFSEIKLSNGYGVDLTFSENLDQYRGELINSWVFKHFKKREYSDKSIKAFFLPDGIKTEELPYRYANMIGYADCLIDTTSTKIRENAKPGYEGMPDNWQQLSQKKKRRLLEKMRNTEVIGMCSMDSSPRDHAINIAVLSAETTNWEVFLKAHLDIMNDRFSRVSDGSYAWDARQTYIRELEELDINVHDLIFGITLRIENAADNHYYGSIGRTGRALAETENRELIENAMLRMIEDDQLDDYNRALIYFLFLNYNHNLQDESIQEENITKLKLSVDYLPSYMSSQISFE